METNRQQVQNLKKSIHIRHLLSTNAIFLLKPSERKTSTLVTLLLPSSTTVLTDFLLYDGN